MIKFTVPIAPVVKKNCQQIIYNKKLRRSMIIQGPRYREYEKACKPYIPSENIDYPVNLKAVFYMPSRRKVDLSNLLESIQDIMTKYKCISDDNCNIIYSLDGSCVKYDKNHPRTEVELTKLENVTTIKDS